MSTGLIRKRETFWTPFEQFAERKGESFEVIGIYHYEPGVEDVDEETACDLYRIRFADGDEIDAWTEEVFQALVDERLAQ